MLPSTALYCAALRVYISQLPQLHVDCMHGSKSGCSRKGRLESKLCNVINIAKYLYRCIVISSVFGFPQAAHCYTPIRHVVCAGALGRVKRRTLSGATKSS